MTCQRLMIEQAHHYLCVLLKVSPGINGTELGFNSAQTLFCVNLYETARYLQNSQA